MGFAETFKALSDPARREILELLKKGPMSAGEIGSHFDMTGATMSYHLKILKKEENYQKYIKVKNCLKNIKEKYLKHLKGDIKNEFHKIV